MSYSYKVCLESGVKINGYDGNAYYFAVKVDENGQCVPPGEDAAKDWVPTEWFELLGLVSKDLCKLSKSCGACPKNYLGIT